MAWQFPPHNELFQPPKDKVYLPQRPVLSADPITRGLVGAWVINEGGGKYFFDAAGNNDGQYVLTQGTHPGRSPYFPHGEALVGSQTGQSDGRINLGSIAGSNPLSLSRSNAATIMMFAQFTAVATNDFPRSFEKATGASGANGYSLQGGNNGQRQCYFYIDGVQRSTSNSSYYINGVPHIYTVVRNGLQFDWYRDLTLHRAHTSGYSANFPTGTADAAIGGATFVSDREWAGPIWAMYVWDRALQYGEIFGLVHDLYKPIASGLLPWQQVAGGAVETFATASLDALLKREGILATATLDALLKREDITRTASLDALLQRLIQATASLDALLKREGILTTSSLDALLQRQGILTTALLDAVLTRAGTLTTASLDALLQRLGIITTASLDALIQRQGILTTASLDALLLRLVQTTASLDALLKREGNLSTASLDALLQRLGITTTASLDAILERAFTGQTASLDALLKREGITTTALLDAILIADATAWVAISPSSDIWTPVDPSAATWTPQ